MKRIITALIVFLLVSLNSMAFAEASKGVIVFYNDNVIVIQDMNTYSYLMGDVYSIGFHDVDDIVVGEMNSFGFHDFYNLNNNTNIHVYVDETMANSEDAIRWLHDKGY